MRGVFLQVLYISLVLIFIGSCTPKVESGTPTLRKLADSLDRAHYAGDQYLVNLLREELMNQSHPDSALTGSATVRIFDLSRLMESGELHLAEERIQQDLKWARDNDMGYVVAKLYAQSGNLKYYQGNLDEASDWWQRALEEIARNGVGLDYSVGSYYNNLGIVALEQEQYKTAVDYFQNAQERFLATRGKDSNYWTCKINEAAARIELGQLNLAESLLNNIDRSYSPFIEMLYHLNRAKLALFTEDSVLFFKEMELCVDELDESPNYLDIVSTLYMRGALAFAQYSLPEWLLPVSASADVSFYTLLHHRLRESRGEAGIYSTEFLRDLSKDNLSGSDVGMIYESLMEDYLEAEAWVDLSTVFAEFRDFEKTRIAGELEKREIDMESYEHLRKLETQNAALLEENSEHLISLNRTSWILWGMAILILFMLLWYGMYLKIQRKRKTLAEKEKIITDMKLHESEREKEEMAKQKDRQQRKIKRTAQLIKQIQSLKDEISDLHKSFGTRADVEEAASRISKLRINFNLLFAQYNDFTMDIMSDGRLENLKGQFMKKYSALTDREATVAALIALDFSTSDIAKQLNRSVKNIEYQRTILRKKLDIDSEVSLNHFIGGVFN